MDERYRSLRELDRILKLTVVDIEYRTPYRMIEKLKKADPAVLKKNRKEVMSFLDSTKRVHDVYQLQMQIILKNCRILSRTRPAELYGLLKDYDPAGKTPLEVYDFLVRNSREMVRSR